MCGILFFFQERIRREAEELRQERERLMFEKQQQRPLASDQVTQRNVTSPPPSHAEMAYIYNKTGSLPELRVDTSLPSSSSSTLPYGSGARSLNASYPKSYDTNDVDVTSYGLLRHAQPAPVRLSPSSNPAGPPITKKPLLLKKDPVLVAPKTRGTEMASPRGRPVVATPNISREDVIRMNRQAGVRGSGDWTSRDEEQIEVSYG